MSHLAVPIPLASGPGGSEPSHGVPVVIHWLAKTEIPVEIAFKLNLFCNRNGKAKSRGVSERKSPFLWQQLV